MNRWDTIRNQEVSSSAVFFTFSLLLLHVETKRTRRRTTIFVKRKDVRHPIRSDVFSLDLERPLTTMARRNARLRSNSKEFVHFFIMDEIEIADQSYDYLFKLISIGESTVGKTTFLHQYIHENFANFRSTIGIDIFKKCINYKNDQRVLLQLWDTAGQVIDRMRFVENFTSFPSGTLSKFNQFSLSGQYGIFITFRCDE